MKYFLIIFFLLISFANVRAGEDVSNDFFDHGLDQLKQGNKAGAYHLFLQASERGKLLNGFIGGGTG